MKNVTIRNATFRMVLVPCNSGRNLHLPPRGASAEIPESEIRCNARVEKLLRRKVIVLQPAGSATAPSKAPAPRSASPKKKKSRPAEPKS